jgi:hypothetical protein
MKINNLNINRVKAISSQVYATKRTQAPKAVTQDQVSISGKARFLSELREASGSMTDIRTDVVDKARHDVASGLLGTEADYDSAIEALLMEL